MSYRDLEIWKLARQIAIAVHRMTLENRAERADIPNRESRIPHLTS